MIDHLVRKFERLDKDVEALSNVLLIFIVLLFARVTLLIYEHRFDELWAILAPMTALVAALLVARVASRLITNNNIIREDDRRMDIVRVTHHLLAVAQDLRARVDYVKTMLSTGNRPVFALGEIVSTIERRYETLLERDSYQYLSGPSVDLIIRMSGSIFGICTLARGLEKATTDKPLASIDSVLPSDREQQVANLGDLMDGLNKLIDQIYEVRASIDSRNT
jgi:hypothetical protein